jgi:hypothetical protein
VNLVSQLKIRASKFKTYWANRALLHLGARFATQVEPLLNDCGSLRRFMIRRAAIARARAPKRMSKPVSRRFSA